VERLFEYSRRVKFGLTLVHVKMFESREEQLALSQRLSPLGLIFRSPTPTSNKIILVQLSHFLIYYNQKLTFDRVDFALSKTALLINFDQELLKL